MLKKTCFILLSLNRDKRAFMCHEAFFKILCLFILYQHVVKYEYTQNLITERILHKQLPYISPKKSHHTAGPHSKVIAFLSPDNCAILHNQYSGDGILLIGKILQ